MSANVRHAIRPLIFACVALVAAAPAGATLDGSARGAAAQGSYTDASGDAGAAPDLTEVVVSNDAAGRITMRIGVPNRPQLAMNDVVIVWINADQNAATGRFGDEYRLEKYGFGTYFERWDGSVWQPFTPASLLVRWETGQLVLEVGRADLGIGAAFDFDAAGLQVVGEDPNAWPWDNAPDFGSWTYTVLFAPTLGPARMQPARPKAGRLLSVSVPVQAGGASVDAGTVKCSASVGVKRLRVAASGLNAGAAGCSWRLPVGTAGKTLRGSVTVTTEGGTATRTFSAKVR